MSKSNKKLFQFEIEPENVEPTIAIWFDGTAEEEEAAGEITSYWARDKVTMVQDLEHEIRTLLLLLDLTPIFDKFYENTDNEVPFFEELETALNLAGYYTYNSDTRFEIYSPSDIDLSDENIKACFDDEEPEEGKIWINVTGVTAYQLEQIKLNLLAHIQEEIRCEVFPEAMSFKIFTQ